MIGNCEPCEGKGGVGVGGVLGLGLRGGWEGGGRVRWCGGRSWRSWGEKGGGSGEVGGYFGGSGGGGGVGVGEVGSLVKCGRRCIRWKWGRLLGGLCWMRK